MSKKQKIIFFYFMILPFIDVITSLITRFTDLPISLGMIVKGLTMLFVIVYIIFFSHSKYQNRSLKYLILLLVFAILYFVVKPDIWNFKSLATEFVYAFRYLYFPVMIIGILNIFDDLEIDSNIIKKIIFMSCILYTVLLLIPYFTGTGFNSYRYDSVFGTNGWFYAANETGPITIILLSSITCLIDKNKRWKILFALPIMFAIALIGTKVSYLGLIFVTLLVVIVSLVKYKKDVILQVLALILFLIMVCNFSPTIDNLHGSIDFVNQLEEEEKKEEDIEELRYKYNNINDLIDNKTIDKIITIALNGRESFFLRNYSIYSESGLINQLFGLSWSNRTSINYTFEKKLIEIDYLDIFIHYGIIGFIIYFYPILYFLFKVFRKKKDFHVDLVLYIVLFLLSIAISCFAGHILASPSVSIYVVLLMVLVINLLYDERKIENNEITILALHLNYGGIEKYISSLCNMLKDRFKINIIATYKISDKSAFEFDKNINITYLINGGPNKEDFVNAVRGKNILKIVSEGIKSFKILWLKKYRNIKAIEGINSKYIITTRSFHSKLVGEYADQKIIKIATEHNHHNNQDKYINNLIKSIINFDYLIVVSRELQKFYESRIGNTKCIYIPNVIDSLPKKYSKLDENNIISIGRLEPEKGQLDLINIVKDLKKEISNIKLFLIGDGSLRGELEKKIKENHLENNIIVTGFLSKKEMESYLLKSKLFVMTSYTESFGLVLIEAMSYKIPCIAFDSASGAKELLSHDVGILISNRDKEEMVKSIVNLFNDNKALKKYSNNGYKECHKYLSSNVKMQWLQILK